MVDTLSMRKKEVLPGNEERWSEMTCEWAVDPDAPRLRENQHCRSPKTWDFIKVVQFLYIYKTYKEALRFVFKSKFKTIVLYSYFLAKNN